MEKVKLTSEREKVKLASFFFICTCDSQATEMTPTRIKIVLVGDGATGKTSLLQRFADGTFSEEYVPTIFENQAKTIHVSHLYRGRQN